MKKVLLVVLAVVAIVAPQAVFASEAPQLVATAVMPDIALKTSSNLAIESSVAKKYDFINEGKIIRIKKKLE